MAVMALHVVEPTPESTVNFFSAAHEPVLTMDPGDTVIVRTLDAAGYLARQQYPGDAGQLKMFPRKKFPGPAPNPADRGARRGARRPAGGADRAADARGLGVDGRARRV